MYFGWLWKMLNEGAEVIGRDETWVIGGPLMGVMLGADGRYPSCHGLRFTMGIVMASHGTRGLLKQNCMKILCCFG